MTQRETREAGEASEGREPIAIVGIGCRFPGGANTPEAFWRMLVGGVDAIGEIPQGRFDVEALYDPTPAARGKIITRQGGFLDQVDRFDANFFGISPREATAMDPQQRLLLEVAWEAIEDAGVTPARLAGTPTGVFVGMWTGEYEDATYAASEDIDLYVTTGGGRYAASGRLSYVLDVQGPSLTVDTACSSSLVAVHLACQSLRSGESTLALAGAVNLILAPQISIGYSRSRMLSPDARCKFGDARANGYVRSEGAAVVVLKPLSRALADGDSIYAVIRGSAVNNDGHSSGLLVAPSGQGQAAMLQAAYRDAGVMPGAVHYVEAHGTGTAVGDPVELQALGSVLAQGRASDQPCVLGSVKTNIGHCEAASGLAGLIKAALCLRHRAIPPSLHFETPNPNIPWADLPLTIARSLLPWPVEGTALAGVNSFGVTGTNAHVVLEEAPPVPVPAAADTGRAHLLPLSAASPEALAELTRAVRAQLATDPPAVADLCYTAALRRAHYDYRLAAVGRSAAELIEQLDMLLEGEPPPVAEPQTIGPVFIFPGQGSQWAGMGRRLLAEEPAFRAAIERCDAAIRAEAGWSPIERLRDDDGLDSIDVIQPTLFAVQVSLAALWRAWGIEPAVVVGHSMGEVAAAHVAGILSIEDAAAVICRRSRLLRRISGQGAMAAVELTAEQAGAAIAGYEDRLAIAVSNSPNSTVIAGDPAALDEVLTQLQARDIYCRRVKVDVASHSPQVDPLREELLAALATISPRPATTPFFSTVTARFEDGASCDARYWERNLRQPVRFADAVQYLLDRGHSAFVEASPHPILLPAIEGTLHHLGRAGHTIPSVRRDSDESAAMLAALGRLYTLGVPVGWEGLHPAGGRVVPLPRYPWQRERFWYEGSAQTQAALGRRGKPQHPLLGWPLPLAGSEADLVWENDLTLSRQPYAYDHRVRDTVVLPASAYLEIACAAARVSMGEQAFALNDVALQRALYLDPDASTAVQVALSPGHDGLLRIYSRAGDTWALNARARVSRLFAGVCEDNLGAQLDTARSRLGSALDADAAYSRLVAAGAFFDERLRRIQQVWCGAGEAVARLDAPRAGTPFLLDACFQVAALALLVDGQSELAMPTSIEAVRLYDDVALATWCYVRPRSGGRDGQAIQDVALFDEAGRLVATLDGVRMQQLGAVRDENLGRWFYAVEWRALEPAEPERGATGSWLILADHSGVGATLAAACRASGERAVVVRTGAGFEHRAEDEYMLRPDSAADMDRLIAEVIGAQPLSRVVHLWSLDLRTDAQATAADLEAANDISCGSVLHLIRSLAESSFRPRVWVATRGAQRISAEGGAGNVFQAPVWGFGRVVAEEHPELWGGLIDLDPATDLADTAAGLEAVVRGSGDENQIVLREGRRYVARLVRQDVSPTVVAYRWRADGAYVITGGLGGLGAEVARWMVRQGARRLILLGRTPLPPRKEWLQLDPNTPAGSRVNLVRDLERMGATIHVAAVDVADEAGLARFLRIYHEEGWPPICGVVHMAAVFDHRLIAQLDRATLREVLRPKAIGAWVLRRLLGTVEQVVLFSSSAALLPQAGQASYAAANAFLDGLADASHGRLVTIGWGPWSDVGKLTTEQGQRQIEQLVAQGGGTIRLERGLEALERVLAANVARTTVVPADWAAFAATRGRARAYPLLAELLAEAAAVREEGAPARRAMVGDDLAAAEPGQRRALLIGHVQEQLARILKLPPARISPTKPLGTLGLDSLMAVELRNQLEIDLELKLSATIVWNYPTVQQLADYLLERIAPQLGSLEPATPPQPATPQAQPAAALTQIVAQVAELSDEDALNALLGTD